MMQWGRLLLIERFVLLAIAHVLLLSISSEIVLKLIRNDHIHMIYS